MRIALLIEYDGTNFCGWQIQKNGITIQESLENAYFEALGERVRITGSGRTDSGVHAEGQIAHFDTALSISAECFANIINAKLCEEIRVLKSWQVSEDFHARFSAKIKTYEYKLYKSRIERPLKNRYAVRVNEDLDVEKMKQTAKLLVGTHDFVAFSSTGSSVVDTVRTIYQLDVTENAENVVITVTGNGFLYNMVRIIAGALVAVATNQTTIENVKSALECGKRDLLGKTMPPQGLTLKSVEYQEDKIVLSKQ